MLFWFIGIAYFYAAYLGMVSYTVEEILCINYDNITMSVNQTNSYIMNPKKYSI